MSWAERAERYARGVVAGDVEVCRWVRLACQRHLDDMARQGEEDFPYYFDANAADKVGRFVELMPHIKGRWAQERLRLKLEDWQCFMLAVPFGWKRKADDLRRVRRVYVEVPRKNAKSTVTAALGLYMFADDGEHGAEVYSGAGSEKQAWEVFRPARLMANKTDAFRDAFGVMVGAKNLHIPARASRFEPIVGKPGDGASPSFSITDEYHEHATSEQYDTMVTGMGSRDQPMAWVITTAGTTIEGPCYDLRSDVTKVLDGSVDNPELFGLVYTIDEEDDWTSEAALRKANPNMGVSIREDYLRSQQRDAINNPRKQATFKTKHLNVWTTAASPYFNIELWNRLGDPSLTPEQFIGEPCWIGLDLASKIDLCTKVLLFRRWEDEEWHYYAFATNYNHAKAVEQPENAHYRGWAEQGWLTVTPGERTDFGYIESDIKADSDRHQVVAVRFDPKESGYLINNLIDYGVLCEEVPQNTMRLDPPMKEVQAVIETGNIHHNGDPVFAWGMGNVTAKPDRNENVFPRKERPQNKIDPAVALIIAMGGAMLGEPEPQEPTIFALGS